MEYFWPYLIPIVAIIGGITYAILAQYWKRKTEFTTNATSPNLLAALEANTQASSAIIARLDVIDSRLGAVEKTLTDIP